MEGPPEHFRAWVGQQIQTILTEDELDGLLSEIASAAESDVSTGGDHQSGEELLAAVDAWAGLASHVMSRFYAPASPWPRNVAGWSRRALARLRRVCGALLPALTAGAKAVGASSWSISVGFPWGISIGLTWP